MHALPRAVAASTPPDVLREARFVARAGDVPPVDASGAPRRLPDDWRRMRERIAEGWYALPFIADPTAHAEWAAYLPSLSMNAAVWVNDRFLGDGGRLTEPVARNWSRPLLFTIPADALVRGDNTLWVRLRADVPGTGLLAPVLVGDREDLARAYTRRYAREVTAVQVITLCLAIAATFTAALWMRWRDDAAYGWFAAAAMAWAAIDLNALVVDPPIGTTAWYACWYVAVGWWATCLLRFVLAFVGDADRRVARAAVVLGGAGTSAVVALAIAATPWMHVAAKLWSTLTLLVVPYVVVRVVRTMRARAGAPRVVVAGVLGVAVLVCALHDWTVFVGFAGATYEYWLPYAAPPVLLGMSWALLRRFVGALRESEALVVDLERRVDTKRRELAESYDRLRGVERAQVVAAERERLMREMHDGVGSHLVSTLALLESPEPSRAAVEAAVSLALDDLRLIVDALPPADADLVLALASLRMRMQPRFESAGIDVVWRVAELEPMATLRPETVLQVLRIVQEAMTNVLQHAAARSITVTTGMTTTKGARRASIEVRDDGRGFGDAPAFGRGLQHMRQRARAAGVSLDIDGSVGGTRIRLQLEEAVEP